MHLLTRNMTNFYLQPTMKFMGDMRMTLEVVAQVLNISDCKVGIL